MCKPKILITVEGGMVQSVTSNTDVDVIIIDYDVEDPENPVSIQHGPQDDLFANGKAYKAIEDGKFPISEEEREVLEYLKEVKF